MMTGIPIKELLRMKLISLFNVKSIKESYWSDEAVAKIVKAIQRNRVGQKTLMNLLVHLSF